MQFRHVLARAIAVGGLAVLAMPATAQTDGEWVHGLAVFGPEELKYPPDFEHFDYVNPDAPVGGQWSTGIGGITFDSLNGFTLKGNPVVGMELTYDTLMTGAADEPSAMYPLLAEAAKVAPDHSSVTFRLNEEAEFRNGEPVTAEDVAWTFNALVTEGHPSYRINFASVTGVEALDERTVRFDFDPKAPLRDMPTMVAGLPVLEKAWWEGRNFSDSTLEAPMGSGPYEVSKVDAGRSIAYTRRDDYWGWDLPVNEGRWNFGEVRWEYFRDRSAAFEAFKSGVFLFYEEFWSKLWATAYNFPAIEKGWVKTDVIPDERPAGTQGYWFNLRREKFQDPRVRQAIAEVFDFEWSNKTLFYDLYERTDSFFEGGPMQAEGPPSEAERALLESLNVDLPEGALDQPAYQPPVTEGRGRNRRALRNAAKLLDEAGWTVENGVRVNEEGEPLTIEFLLVGEGFERITNPFIDNLATLGIKATARTVDPAQYKRRMDQFDFDIAVEREAMSLTPGVELRDMFHSSTADEPGSENITGLQSEAVDRLIEVIERANTRESLTTAVKALDRVLRGMHIWIPQWSKPYHHLAYWDIFGRPDIKPKYARGVIDLWWVDPEKYEGLKPHIGA